MFTVICLLFTVYCLLKQWRWRELNPRLGICFKIYLRT